MKIELNENGIWIDGSCQVILASSLFYFRIPQERWEQRMKLLKAADRKSTRLNSSHSL